MPCFFRREVGREKDFCVKKLDIFFDYRWSFILRFRTIWRLAHLCAKLSSQRSVLMSDNTDSHGFSTGITKNVPVAATTCKSSLPNYSISSDTT